MNTPAHTVLCQDERCRHRGSLHAVYVDGACHLFIVHSLTSGKQWTQGVAKPVASDKEVA